MEWLPGFCVFCMLLVPLAASAHSDKDLAKATVQKGTVTFRPKTDQSNIPERYRLEQHLFDYTMTLKRELHNSGVQVYDLQFPSPVITAYHENNTIYAEYYLPLGKGPFPCSIVLDITAGGEGLSRTIATHLAQNGIAGLYVQMPFYGPRRPRGSDLRLLSPDYQHSMAAVRQTVLDMRQAAAWMESRAELDSNRLAILGTSLGSFMAALSAEMEPRFSRVVVLLGGGGLVDAYYDDPRAEPVREVWEALGGTKEKMAKLIAPADPLTCAGNLRDRKLLIIAGKRDDVVFPKMAEALWEAAGKQQLVWFDCTHVGAAMYFVPAMSHVVKLLGAE